jgi:cytochrome c biogenesis protein CcmG/thiol:disulfide interchange protein DsbE
MLPLVAGLAAIALAGPPAAPPLQGRDPVTGKQVSLARYAGRPVVVNLWASWCDGCKKEAADLKAFGQAHPGVQLLGIDVNDSTRGARAFYKRYDQEWPSIFDPKARLATALRALGLPTTYFLDRRHRIVTLIQGAASRAQLEAALRKTLASR